MTKIVSETVQLDQDLDDRVAAVAAVLGQSKAWVIEQAVKDDLSVQEWWLAAIAEGIRDADEGRPIDHEQVVAWFDSRRTELPLPPSQQAELEDRLASLESQRGEGVTWNDLKARMASRSVITPSVSPADAVRSERDGVDVRPP